MLVLFDFYAINTFPLFPVQVQLTVGSDFISDALFFCLFIDKLTGSYCSSCKLPLN